MLEQEHQEYLLKLARQSIHDRLHGVRSATEPQGSPDLEKPCGAFVTLKINGRLRGCIGNIRSTAPLYKTVSEMAVAAATQDPRFPPLESPELDTSHIEISVLSPMIRVENFREIQVGRDGLFIRNGACSGLLLPQVPVEWEWDRNKFLEQTCRKAGLPPKAWKDPDTEIFRFSAEVFGEEE